VNFKEGSRLPEDIDAKITKLELWPKKKGRSRVAWTSLK
jgi:hypothetical protein